MERKQKRLIVGWRQLQPPKSHARGARLLNLAVTKFPIAPPPSGSAAEAVAKDLWDAEGGNIGNKIKT